MTTELQQNRYDQLLRRVGDLKGPGSKVSEVLSELFPVLDVENVPGELLRLARTNICFGGTVVGPDATKSSRIQLFNPVGSSVIATVSSVMVSSGQGQVVRWSVGPTALTSGIGVESFRDARAGFTNQPVCQLRTDLTVALTDATGQMRVESEYNVLDDTNSVAVLTAGSGLEFGAGSNNTTLFVTFYWRERVIEPSEVSA